MPLYRTNRQRQREGRFNMCRWQVPSPAENGFLHLPDGRRDQLAFLFSWENNHNLETGSVVDKTVESHLYIFVHQHTPNNRQ